MAVNERQGWSLLTRIDAYSSGGVNNSTGFADGRDRPRDWNRFMGGRRRTNHPFIGGYWYFFLEPPAYVFQNDNGEATNWWFSTAEGFTPHSTNLTKVDVPGMGGQGSSYVAGREINRTFSVTFREYQNAPIMNFFTMWTAAINDPHFGLSVMRGNEYIPANYKGSAYAVLCKPTHGNHDSVGASLTEDDIEVLWYYDGVFPEGAPVDAFASDISGNDVLQLSVNFSFDGYPLNGKDEVAVMNHFLSSVQSSYTSRAIQTLYEEITTDITEGHGGETSSDSLQNSNFSSPAASI